MKKLTKLSLLLVVFAALGCNSNNPYMTINDETVITVGQFQQEYDKMFPSDSEEEANEYVKMQNENMIANYFVSEYMLNSIQESYDFEITEEQKENEIIARMCPYFRVPNVELVNFYLSKQGGPFDNVEAVYEYQLKSNVALFAVVKQTFADDVEAITDEALTAEYEKYSEYFVTPEQYKVARFFIPKETPNQVENEDGTITEGEPTVVTLDEAILIKNDITSLKSFNKAAAEYVEDVENLTEILIKENLEQDMASAIDLTAAESVSEVIETETGFYLVWVFEKYEAYTFSQEELTDALVFSIIGSANNDAVNELAKSLFEQPEVVYNEKDRLAAKATAEAEKAAAKAAAKLAKEAEEEVTPEAEVTTEEVETVTE